MAILNKAGQFAAAISLIALTAGCGGGGGTTVSGGTTTGSTGSSGGTGSTSGGTTTITGNTGTVSISAPDGPNTSSVNSSFNFTSNPPANGTTLPLLGTATKATNTTVSAPGFTGSQAPTVVWRGTTTGSGGRQVPILDLNLPALGITATNLKGDGTPASASGGAIAINTYSLTYSMLGVWSYVPSSSTAYFGMATTGSATPAASMPTSGTATYTSSNAAGYYFVPSAGQVAAGLLNGSASLTANFGTGSLSGSVTNITATPLTGSATPWNSLNLSGTISGNQTSGSVTTTGAPSGAGTAGFSSAATGSFQGSFYGPNADELGVNWTLTEAPSAGGGGGKTAMGSVLLGK